jgi:hypothetical protein
MLPCLIDGGFHVVRQDDELRRSSVVMGAEAHNVHLSHGGRKIAKKPGESRGVGYGLSNYAAEASRSNIGIFINQKDD